jgi:protein-S-isoprenylcysteine O-methyltransferase
MLKLAWLVVLLFPITELALGLSRRSRPGATRRDEGSMAVLWIVISASVFAAIVARSVGSLRIAGPPVTILAAGLMLLIGGQVLRWASIVTLGSYFTVDVALQDGQSVITTGPYRWIRHPSYTGLLIAFLGLGIVLGNWLSVIVLIVPILLALSYRIRIEERVLRLALGEAYATYCQRTARLVPWLY